MSWMGNFMTGYLNKYHLEKLNCLYSQTKDMDGHFVVWAMFILRLCSYMILAVLHKVPLPNFCAL